MRYSSTLILAVILGLSVSALVAGPGAKGPAPGQTAAQGSVRLLISATDSKGNPLFGLSKDQVSIFEGNQPMPTLSVQSASDLPLHLGFVLLASKTKFDQEQAATMALAQKIMRPGIDEAFVVTAGGDRPWPNPNITWLKDAASVAETVHGLDKNAGLPDLFTYNLATDSAGLGRLSVQTYNLGNGFSVFDVIWLMMKNDPRPARRAVVIFRLATAHSPGLDEQAAVNTDKEHNRSLSSEQQVTGYSQETHNRVIGTAQSLGISFFTIGMDDKLISADINRNQVGTDYMPTHGGGDDGMARKYDQDMMRRMELQYMAGRDNVNRIADETGGRPFWTTKKNFADAVTGISNEIAAQYFVNVAAPAAAPGEPASIKVQVAGAGHVSAPRALIPAGQ
jgi:hypothetical protein